jgi:hypothetical protein
MRKLPRRLATASLVLVVGALPARVASEEKDPPEPARKDAAEAVGEGNAARWLDYYRRERGENWKEPVSGDAQKSNVQDKKPDAPSKR